MKDKIIRWFYRESEKSPFDWFCLVFILVVFVYLLFMRASRNG